MNGFTRNERRRGGDNFTHRLGYAAAARRTIEVQSFHLQAHLLGLRAELGSHCKANTHFVRFPIGPQ